MPKKARSNMTKAERIEYALWLTRVNSMKTNFARTPTAPVKDRSLVYDIQPKGSRSTQDIPSVTTPGGDTSPLATTKYTGTKMLGVGVMHKSNAVPIFQEDHAKDLASMRR